MPWAKGESGNKSGGRPQYRAHLLKRLHDEGLVDQAVDVIKDELKSGKKGARLEAARWVLDQIAGKAPQTIEHRGDEDAPLKIEIIAAPKGILVGNLNPEPPAAI